MQCIQNVIREIVEAADFVGSTSAIIDYVDKQKRKILLLGQRWCLLRKCKELAPNKNLHTIMDEIVQI